jgi:antitoxin ParD1/3/4
MFPWERKNAFATPSEYVRALIRSDVFKELLNAAEDIKNGRTYSAKDVKQHMLDFLNDIEK